MEGNVEVEKNHERKAASDGRIYYSYADIHKTLEKMVPEIKKFKPDLILAIGGGGYIPARILRSYLKVPILAISLGDTFKSNEYVFFCIIFFDITLYDNISISCWPREMKYFV